MSDAKVAQACLTAELGRLGPCAWTACVATQGGLPLVPRPYDAIAQRARHGGGEVSRAISGMLDSGVIRRIGVVPNHYALGYTANGMSVWDVATTRGRARRERSARSNRDALLPAAAPAAGVAVQPVRDGARRARAEVAAQVDTIATLLGTTAARTTCCIRTRILKKTGLRIAD